MNIRRSHFSVGACSAVRIAAAIAALAALGPVPVASSAEQAPPVSMTLEQVLRQARARNRSLVVERARVRQAGIAIEQGWTSLFPTVFAQGKYSHNYKQVELMFGPSPLLLQPSEQLDGTLGFNAPLFAPAAYPALDALRASARAAQANETIAEDQMLIAVAQTFYAASIGDEIVTTRRSSVEVARATLENAKARFSAGAVTKVDLDRAELAVMRGEQAVREAELGRQHTYRALATLIQETRPFQVQLEAFPPEQHDESELDKALSLRPEFHALEATIASFEAQARAQKWRWAPSVAAFGNARKFNYDNFARDRYSWVVGAQLDWAIYDGGARDSDRHLAEARVEEALARTVVLRDTIRDDLANGKTQLETKLQGLQTAERSVSLARETVDLVRVQYEAGAVTQVELLQAQDALVAAQEGLAQARYDVAAADLTLRHAAGTFPPH